MSIKMTLFFEEALETLMFKGYESLVGSNVKSAGEVDKVKTDIRFVSQQFN
jgi:hypothetical protein